MMFLFLHSHRLVVLVLLCSALLTEGLTIFRPYRSRRCIRSTAEKIEGYRIETFSRLRVVPGNGHENLGDESVGCIEGYIPEDQRELLEQTLLDAGYEHVVFGDNDLGVISPVYRYKFVKASGMLQLLGDPNNGSKEVPKYIPIYKGMENVLVANGWSFLDPDESEPISAFDLDAANKEGRYNPKWGMNESNYASTMKISVLGYNIQHEQYESIIEASLSERLSPEAKRVLLEGGTDQPHVKRTNNGYDFSTALLQSEQEGIFVCAIGSLPLFATVDMAPPVLSASSGWLSFKKPISEDHIELVYPDKLDLDQRIEVVDAKTNCHLGHYFGKSDGYCINASALNFVPLKGTPDYLGVNVGSPFSWRALDGIESKVLAEPSNPSHVMLRKVLLSNIRREEILFGAGCFWHVEAALRRLPGVVDTKTGYAGGTLDHPTYKDICTGTTSHAEVVRVAFDSTVCDARQLIDCWLAMHDPTNVRAHGKRAKRTGQYRSCVFVFSEEMQHVANRAIRTCQQELGKELSSEIQLLSPNEFWIAEERHQRHDERKPDADLGTLSFDEWLQKFGRRSRSVFGSSETIQLETDHDDLDDGIARMMI